MTGNRVALVLDRPVRLHFNPSRWLTHQQPRRRLGWPPRSIQAFAPSPPKRAPRGPGACASDSQAAPPARVGHLAQEVAQGEHLLGSAFIGSELHRVLHGSHAGLGSGAASCCRALRRKGNGINAEATSRGMPQSDPSCAPLFSRPRNRPKLHVRNVKFPALRHGFGGHRSGPWYDKYVMWTGILELLGFMVGALGILAVVCLAYLAGKRSVRWWIKP